MNEHLHRLFTDAGKLELVLINDRGWIHRGVFDCPDQLLAAAKQHPGYSVYTSINAPSDRVPATNRLLSAARGRGGLRAEHFIRRTSLFFDLDPVRPARVNATRDEMMRAGGQAYRLIEFTDALGWPQPTIINSGNGAHLHFRCDLPATPQIDALLARRDEILSRVEVVEPDSPDL